MNSGNKNFVDLRSQPMSDTAMMVFTSQSLEKMLRTGISLAWKVGAAARQCGYLVCTWNSGGEWAQPNSGLAHGEGFLVALISAIEPADPSEGPGRFNIRFRQFSRISIPRLWNGNRNPFTYTTLDALGIDPDQLRFETIPESVPTEAPVETPRTVTASLTIAQAKEALAATYGVRPQAVEITIRG